MIRLMISVLCGGRASIGILSILGSLLRHQKINLTVMTGIGVGVVVVGK
jgi:hypothetical protein